MTKTDGDVRAMTTAPLRELYETARSSVLHGVTWDGTPESIGGVTKDEALADAAALIEAIEQAGGISNMVEVGGACLPCAAEHARSHVPSPSLRSPDGKAG